jgi:hypothetical protein
MCNERVSDYSFITVEDDRNNLFETRRNFATIAEQQGFVNVISSEYMLREYMSDNTELFTADAKAIPYITADYARTKRNAILSLCLLLCIDAVREEVLCRQLSVLNISTEDPAAEIWKEICVIFGEEAGKDKKGFPVLCVRNRAGKTVCFEKEETICFKRAYSIETGKFESVYAIENTAFSSIILDDLQNASYIAEQESKDVYIGTELKGHVYQKYMPGQFFTLNGKYYEMIATATDNRILVRRASEHIGGRLAYRQVRNYIIHHLEDASSMGALKTVNNIDIHYQFANFSVETPGYWRMHAYNDFDNGDLVKVNGIPVREYRHKQILKFGFSKMGDAFTDSVRMTLTNLLNEVFVTLFAENQPFISAVTPGQFDAPLTYSLSIEDADEDANKCIYIIEDSQLDIGLLVAVERNINRILQIVADYLSWNDEKIEESQQEESASKKERLPFDIYEEAPKEKKGLLGRIKDLFRRKKKVELETPALDYMMIYGKPHKLVNGKWVACSQEEFDAKMSNRHQKLAENKEKRKTAEAEEKAQEAMTRAEAEQQTSGEADEAMSQVKNPDEVRSDDKDIAEENETGVQETVAPTELSDETATLAPKGWLARRKAEKAEKKLAKEAKRAEKKAIREAQKAEKASRKQAPSGEQLVANETELLQPEGLNTQAEVSVNVEPQEETVEECVDQEPRPEEEPELVHEQEDGEVSENV